MGYQFDNKTGEFKQTSDNNISHFKCAKFCYNCGESLPIGANFCPQCGTKVCEQSISIQKNDHKNDSFQLYSSKSNSPTIAETSPIHSRTNVTLPRELRITKSLIPSTARRIVIPNTFEQVDEDAFEGLYDLRQIDVSNTNMFFRSIDGVLFDIDITCLIRYPRKRTSNSYIIPDTVVRIFPHAFEGCSQLTSIILPQKLQEIGAYAFEGCIIGNMQIPSHTIIKKGGHTPKRLRKMQMRQNQKLE